MLAWRLCRRPHADLSGEGARRLGGRWNSPGRPLIYLAEHPALAALEVRLHLDLPFDLLPADYHGPTRGCDTVITRDGRFVYFANRDDDFLYAFKCDPRTGELTPMRRSSCGGKTPRNFVLDPTERWMLVANQDSSQISVFARHPETGELAEEGRNYPADTPMRILFI